LICTFVISFVTLEDTCYIAKFIKITIIVVQLNLLSLKHLLKRDFVLLSSTISNLYIKKINGNGY